MKEAALRGEVFCRLKTIGRQYKHLQKYTYPTDGPEELLALSIKIIDRIIERFAVYSISQVKHIAQLCSIFEEFCGYLNETRMGNVPWSIIPALEGLFQVIQEGNEFAICPIWESNYKVVTRNVVSLLKELGSTANLLFDADNKAELDSQSRNFFGLGSKGVYFLFYPKLERISAVHFALLGHEIGHIYAEKWIEEKFESLIKDNHLEETFSKIASDEFKMSPAGKLSGESPDLFKDNFILIRKNEMLRMCWKVMKEIIADIYGAYIFGDAAIVAQLLFLQRGDMDDTSQWNNSWQSVYPSHRFRVKLISDAIAYLKTKLCFSREIKSGWEDMVEECCNEPILDSGSNDYVKCFIQALEKEKASLFDDVAGELKANVFLNFIKKDMITAGVERLNNGIPPNVYIDHDGKEIPIDFRNILYATTLCLAKGMPRDLEEYERKSQMINHLGIKAIELSKEQERYDAYQKGSVGSIKSIK